MHSEDIYKGQPLSRAPCEPDIYHPRVAQWWQRLLWEQEAAGSNSVIPTNIIMAVSAILSFLVANRTLNEMVAPI